MPMLKLKVSWFLKFWVGSLVVLIWETHTRRLTKILKFQGSLEHLTRIGNGIFSLSCSSPDLSPAFLRKVQHIRIYNREPLSFTKFYGDMNLFPSLQLGLTPAMLCLC